MTLQRYVDRRITPEDRESLDELFKADKAAYAEIITDYIDPVYLTLDIASSFMNTRALNLGDIHVRRFKGKYHVQTLVPGSITLAEQITTRDQAVSYGISIIAAKAGYNTLELQNGGQAVSPEAVRKDVQAALNEKVLLRTWNALGGIWKSANATALTIPGSSQSNFIDASGPLTSSALDAAIDHVNYWSGSVRSIIGTESALAPLSTFGQYQLISGTNTDNYVTTNGQPAGTFNNVSPYGNGPKGVEVYRGVSNIVRIKQLFDDTVFPPRPLLPTDFVLVVGDNIGDFITYGGAQYKEYTDMEPTPPYWTYETWLQFGMMIWNARGLVKIAVSGNTVP